MTDALRPGGPDDLAALAARLGSAVAEAVPAQWGDTRSVTHLRLVDGRDLAARRLVGAAAGDEATGLAERAANLREAGIRVAWPVERHATADGWWVVTPWVPGPLGASLIGDPAGRRELAASMGRLATRLSSVEVSALALDRTWAEPSLVASQTARGLEAIRGALGEPATSVVSADLERIARAGTGEGAWTVGLAHGDLAPVNVVVDDDGGLVLLDLSGLRVGPRILDVAWWGWILRFHHPEAWADMWDVFLDGARMPATRDVDAVAPAVARLLLLERAVEASGDDDRARWLGRLRTTASW